MSCLIIIITFLFIKWPTHSINAQEGSYFFRPVTTGEELTHAWITSIEQDFLGFIWIGTVDGLYRFDGYEFKNYRSVSGDTNTIAGNYVNAIYQDSKNNLWVATRKGPSIYDRKNNVFTHLNIWPKLNVTSITESNGDIFFGSIRGIWEINPDEYSVAGYLQYPDSSDAVNGSQIIISDGSGNLVSGNSTGITQFNTQTKKFANSNILPENFSAQSINEIIVDYKGTIWISTREFGLIYFESKAPKLLRQLIIQNQGLTKKGTVLSIMQSSDEILWIGTENNGLILLDLKAFYDGKIISEHIISEDTDGGLTNNSIYSIFQDNQKAVWVGTYSGMSLYHPVFGNFRNFRYAGGEENSKNNNIVNSFYEENNKIWVATENGLHLYNRQNKTYQHYLNLPGNSASLSGNAIWSFAKDIQGYMWIGTWGAGLNRFDLQNRKNTRILAQPDNPEKLSSNNIFSIVTDQTGNVWIGTMGGGLNMYDPKTDKFKRYINNNKDSSTISNDWVRQVYIDSKQRFWVSNYTSLDLLDPNTGKFQHYYPSEKNSFAISDDGTVVIFEDSKKHIWLGTETGLNYFDEQKQQFHKFQTADGLPGNVIQSILEDTHGNLWMGTNNGISMFVDAINLPDNPKFENFDVRDGLQGNKFNRRAALSTSDGLMLFGGNNGVTVFNPSQIRQNNYKSPIVFTDLMVFNESVASADHDILNNEPISTAKQITLHYRQSVFTLKFAALNYIIPEKNKYQYILEGFEEKWNSVGNLHSATYTNLDPGEYVFRVKHSGYNLPENDEGSSIRIKILPPWYRTFWAYGIYFIFITVVILIFRRFIVIRTGLQHQINLQNIEKERLDQLTRMKTRFFTNISHEFRTPLTLIISPIESLISDLNIKPAIKQPLVLIQKNARRLLRLINQLMDISQIEADHLKLKVRKGDIVLFVREIVLLFKWLATQRNIEYIFETDIEGFQCLFDGDKIEKISYNLLSNAFKYTPHGGKIEIKLTIVLADTNQPYAGFFQLVVKDNGTGIPESDQEKIYEHFFRSSKPNEISAVGSGVGLALVRGLVNVYGGNIQIISKEEKGTEFIIYLPYEPGFFKVEQIDNSPLADIPVTLDIVDIEHSLDIKSTEISEKSVAEAKAELPLVLIVEDNIELRTHLIEQFTNFYTVLEAADGSEALDKAINFSPNLIISDIRMPVMDGIEFCRHIKSNENTSHIPIILLTAKTSVDDKFEGLSIGADAYITKPFDIKILLATANNLLESRKQLREKYMKNLVIEASDIQITSVDEKFIKKAIAIVEKFIADSDFSVDTFSREIGMSRSHLHRKFVSLTGYSPSGFIRTIRMRRAAQLLSKGQLTVSEILFEVGIKSRSYFTKSFKDQFGVLPTDFEEGNEPSKGDKLP